MEVYVTFLLKNRKKLKMNLFLTMKIKVKINIFSHNKQKFQPRTQNLQFVEVLEPRISTSYKY